MKALLLYPQFPTTFWSFKHALPFVRKRASLPPLGLLTVGALLPPAWEKRLVDANVGPVRDADLAWADIVFIGAMIAQRSAALDLVARCHAAGKTIVAGGPLFLVDRTSFPEVDHFVLDEAEATLPEFLRDLEAGCARRTYVAAAFPALQTTPVPLWELADLRHYASLSIQFSRGCPFDCDFCNITSMFGHRPRTKTAAQVIAELDSMQQHGWRGPVFFVDDNLIGNKRALKQELLPALIAWRQGRHAPVFTTEASINLADDPELMRLMVTAGFESVFIGIETPDDAGLAECDKRQNRGRDLVADVQRMQQAGLQVLGGFIVGFDSDTPAVFQRQVDFIQKSGIVTAMVGLLNAIPKTRLHDRLEREGRLLGDSTGNNTDGTTNFVPRMSMETLVEGYRGILRRIYSPAPYYRRVRTFLRNYQPPAKPAVFQWRNVPVFLHTAWRLGIVGRERFQYWRLLGWTLARRPALFEMAVTLAVYGHHFRKCAAPISG